MRQTRASLPLPACIAAAIVAAATTAASH